MTYARKMILVCVAGGTPLRVVKHQADGIETRFAHDAVPNRGVPLRTHQVLCLAEIEKAWSDDQAFWCVVRRKRFELLTPWFVAKYSIQLSYRRIWKVADYTQFRVIDTNFIGVGGDGGIRTLDAGLSPHAPLAGEYLQPLGHVSEPPRIV